MNNVSFSDAAALGVDWEDDRTRMPDAGIRAISGIIRQGAESTQQMIATLAGASLGLNNVIGGSNPGVAMPPQKISGINANDLASLSTSASKFADDDDKNEPEDKEPATIDGEKKSASPTETPLPNPPPTDSSPPTQPTTEERPTPETKPTIAIGEVSIPSSKDLPEGTPDDAIILKEVPINYAEGSDLPDTPN